MELAILIERVRHQGVEAQAVDAAPADVQGETDLGILPAAADLRGEVERAGERPVDTEQRPQEVQVQVRTAYFQLTLPVQGQTALGREETAARPRRQPVDGDHVVAKAQPRLSLFDGVVAEAAPRET